MAIDLAAIRKRVQELSGQRRTSSVQLWKPEAGDYKVRGIPWKETIDGMPFLERRFYYLGSAPRIVAPPVGKPDPIANLVRKLWSSGKPEDRELAKQLTAKMTAYMAIIVRGQEDKGPQVWSFNKFVYQRLLDFYTNVEINPDLIDYMDPNEGLDLAVSVKPSPKKFNGKTVMDTTIDLGRRPCKLSNDQAQAKKWLDNVPNIDDMYQQKSEKEIEQALNTWLSGGAESETPDEGTGRGQPKGRDALDQLVDDVKSEAPKPATAAPAKTKTKKDPEADLDDAPAAKTSLDDAFKELMQDGDGE